MPNKHKNFIARTSTLLLLLAAGFMFSLVLVSSASASGIAPADVIALVNKARVKEGLAPLAENIKLSQAANAKAHDMIKNDYFAHTSPSGRDPWYWMKKEGYEYKAAGENLAINFTNAKEEQSAWMKSETHRANILNAHYQEIGVAVVEGKIDGQNSIVTVQMFGTPLYAVADQVKTAAPPIVVEEKTPEIKGIETSEIEAALPNVPLSDRPTAQPMLENPQKIVAILPTIKMTWLDITWLISVVILEFALIAPAIAFLFKAYVLLATAEEDANTEIADVIHNNQNGMPEYHLRI